MQRVGAVANPAGFSKALEGGVFSVLSAANVHARRTETNSGTKATKVHHLTGHYPIV